MKLYQAAVGVIHSDQTRVKSWDSDICVMSAIQGGKGRARMIQKGRGPGIRHPAGQPRGLRDHKNKHLAFIKQQIYLDLPNSRATTE
ncbi:putative protein SEM1 [Neophocaena asiaeorientalis asiaeorientalis]|uniref:Uncharacterized protein n=1 Tax=Neophocaena asiaeorientalis asiaeorientalis TaxID=1706337 RepID=A0A341D7U3_NEOAA|nr:putative protein SEM1 [Neophocaena asiaeorientalis asiaeorientalis]